MSTSIVVGTPVYTICIKNTGLESNFTTLIMNPLKNKIQEISHSSKEVQLTELKSFLETTYSYIFSIR